MGLDMYLHLKVPVSNYEYAAPREKILAGRILGAMGIEDQAPFEEGVLIVSLPVGYWRKANAIHHWFVQNTQDGEDNCQESLVGGEQLMELRELCKKVLLDPSMGEELLPTQSGFLFGSTEYDKFYIHSLRNTVGIIDHALKTMSQLKGCFYYIASW